MAEGTPRDRYDVAILGGGLAGLTLSLQLKRARPDLKIFVAEKRKGPAPDAAFKVGESSLEIGADYLARVCGLEDHIEADELPKFGVRFWFPAGDNSDISRRAEYGPPKKAALPTYQLDRGRFENELATRVDAAGVERFDGTKVEDVEFGDEQHTVSFTRDGEAGTTQARWVCGATGRASLIRRKLGLEREVPHKINSAWMRLRGGIDIEDWTDDADWHARMSERGLRWLSTNHLIDTGYWVWIIPLSTGAVSIGIVADPRFHPFEKINTLDGALAWMHDHEPQLAGVLDARRDDIVDFLKVENYSHATARQYSPDRWALTGDAGVFLDPLFSPGSDFIGICNSLITDMILRDADGSLTPEQVEFANDYFLRYFHIWLSHYNDLYPMFGDATKTVLKFSWYRATYFPVCVRLMYADRIGDIEFMQSIHGEMERFFSVLPRLEGVLREWHALAPSEVELHGLLKPPEFAQMRASVIPELAALHDGAPVSDEELRRQIGEMVTLLEATAIVFFHVVAASLGIEVDPTATINPHAIGLKPDRWVADGLYAGGGMTLAQASGLAQDYQPQLEAHVKLGERVA